MKGLLSGRLRSGNFFLGLRWGIASLILLGSFLSGASILFGQPAGYYNDAEGKTGTALQESLHDIIDNHTVLSYSALWTAFYTTDDREDGKVWDMYSDNPDGADPYDYTFGTDQCGNYSGENSCYNREHSFPKSWFNDASPMYTDLFHLYPTDGYVNGQRGNYPFGETDSPTWTSLNGSKLGPSSVNAYSGTIFEPIDAYKGDFARTYFYMAVRYYGEDSGWPGSPMVKGSQLLPWAKEMMVRWHEEDGVSQKEIDRNNEVYSFQGNRNPFIDHPEYVALMYGGGNFDEIPPDLDSITVNSSTSVVLWFNEALDSMSAVNALHFTISGDVSVLSATFPDQNKSAVQLEVSNIQNGSYSITITGLADTAGNTLQLAIFPFEVQSLSLEHYWENQVLQIFPNPGNGMFRFDPGAYNKLVDNLVFYDISGRPFDLEYDFIGKQMEIITTAPAGVYFLKIEFRDGSSKSISIMLR